MVDLEKVYSDDNIIISSLYTPKPEHKTILLSFTGIGHQMGGVRVQKNEFFKSGRGFDNIFFVSDVHRSWGNRLNFDLLREKVAPFDTVPDIYAIGNSMGGFLAVCASRSIPMRLVLAFSAQFSVKKDIVPEETRWQEFIQRIDEFKIPSLENCFDDRTVYFMISGSLEPEAAHWKRFPKKDNIYNIVLNGGSHHIAEELKARNQLDELIQACMSQTVTLPLLKRVNPGGFWIT